MSQKKKITRDGILDYETNLLHILESTTQQTYQNNNFCSFVER